MEPVLLAEKLARAMPSPDALNIAVLIEYDGAEFHGWQRQPGVSTVQAVLEDTLSQVLHRKVTVYGASRTDSGVHAKGQVANFWADPAIEPRKWAIILNTVLPPAIRIQKSLVLPHTFHAQREAVTKIYEYRVLNRPHRSALDRRVGFFPKKIDWDLVREAMRHFLGEHDFVAYQGSGGTVLSTVRRVDRFDLFNEAPGIYRLEAEGNGFLKQMVRAMVGTVLDVGMGKKPLTDIPESIRGRNRALVGQTAPAEGLCLVEVCYGAKFAL